MLSQTDQNEIRQGVRRVLSRKMAARAEFSTLIAEVLGMGNADGQKLNGAIVANYYISNKIARFDGLRYVVKHGAFWDLDVLQRALEQAQA